MPQLNQTGDYIAMIDDYSIREYDSGSVAIAMRFVIYKEWVKAKDGFGWQDRENGEHIDGYSFIVKTDGTINNVAQQALMTATGWDGQIESVIDKRWKPWPCRITVEEDFYEGKRSYKVNWINHADTEPGGFKQLDDESAKSLKARHSSQLRASAAAIQKDMAASIPNDQLNPAPVEAPPQSPAPDEVPF